MNLTKNHIQSFKNFLICEEKSESTIKKYTHDLNVLYEFLDEDKRVTKEILIAYKKNLLSNHKASTTNSMLVAMNTFLQYMNHADLKVKLVKIQNFVHQAKDKELSKTDYQRLLKVSKDKKNRKLDLLIQTICCTGIRVSEHRFITVESLKEGIAIVNNKGKIREIYIPKTLIKSLKLFCKENKILFGPIFITKNGNPIDRSNIWKMMKSLCKDANIDQKKVFPHNLRHLFAKTHYQIEKDIIKLADILGHNNIETTRIYTNLGMKISEKIYSKMNLVLG